MTPLTPEGVVLQTSRLILRRFQDTPEDAQLLLDLDADPEVIRYTGPGLTTLAEARTKLRDQLLPAYARSPVRGFLAAHNHSSVEYLGWLLLRPSTEHRFAEEAGWTQPAEIEMGYRLKRSAWGHGFATEGARALIDLAFSDSSVTAVVAHALITNSASIHVMKKCGLRADREFTLSAFADRLVTYRLNREDRDGAGATP